MASIIPHRVFSDLVTIAKSGASPLDREARIAQRIQQFQIDIAKSRHQDAGIGDILSKIRAGLEAQASSPSLGLDQRSALDHALRTINKIGRKDKG